MPADIKIAKIQFRSGNDDTRTGVVLDRGEPAFTTDKQRVWIGDGITSGGKISGNLTFRGSSLTAFTRATDGDIGIVNNAQYVLNGNDPTVLANWQYIGVALDSAFLELDTSNLLTLKDDSITFDKIASTALDADKGLEKGANGIGIKVDSTTLDFNLNGELELKSGSISTASLADDSITESLINSSALGDGLQGGSGNKIELNVNSNHLDFSGGALNVIGISDQALGAGLYLNVDNEVVSVITGVDTVQGVLDYDSSGSIYHKTVTLPSNSAKMGLPTVNSTGHVTGFNNSIIDTVADLDPVSETRGYIGTENATEMTNAGLSFAPDSQIIPIQEIDTLGVPDVDLGAYDQLESAGFVLMDLGTSSTGKTIGVVALPVYRPVDTD